LGFSENQIGYRINHLGSKEASSRSPPNIFVLKNMDRSFRFQIIAFAFIRTVFNTMFRMVYPFLPVFSRGLGVDLTALSLALTGRQAVGTFGPFLAILLESRGRKVGMLTGLALITGGILLVIVWPVFPIFFVALILTTLGKYIFDPHMQGYLGDHIPYNRRGLALAITELGWSLSFIVGIPLVGFLVSRGGWMSPFGLLAILELASICLIWKIIPTHEDDKVNWGKIWENCIHIFRYQPAIAALSIGIAVSAANEVINLVFGVWLEDTFGLQIMALGGAAAVIGLAELGGESLMGAITDRLGKERSVGLGLVTNCLAAAIFPILGQTLPGAIAALFLFYITFEFTLVAVIPLMTEIMPSARVTLMAFNVAGLSLGRGLGAFTASSLFGFGIGSSAAAAIGFNLVAILGLQRLWISRR
jgi:predicted MFS family arabinose efflux permease